MRQIFKLIGAVLVCQAAGIIGSFFTAPAVPSWYAGIQKPVFNPPSWIFAPVWISLYFMMGVALYLVLRCDLEDRRVKRALYLFAAQLLLNAAWSPIFFGMKAILAAFIVILLLWGLILLTIRAFARLSRPAAVLLIPYFLWVSFAAVLNFAIWTLNR